MIAYEQIRGLEESEQLNMLLEAIVTGKVGKMA